MAKLSGKVVFQLLLLLTLVIQPVMTSYAMANMLGTMQHDASSSKQTHDACHAMKQVNADLQYGDHQQAGNNEMGDCCHSGACCSIAVFAVTNMIEVPSSEYSVPFPVFWGDVIISSEFKPPRSLLS